MQQHTTRLVEKKEIADHVLELHFEKPEGITFVAGQFLQFLIPEGEKLTPRSYSIASTPSDSTLIFCVKIVENGLASTYFSNMNVGDSVDVKGPLGRFICNEEATTHSFIATGAGLAPIIGMIRDELENKQFKNPIELLFGVRAEKDVFWKEELDNLSSTHDNFTYTLCLSRPEDDSHSHTGRVTAHLNNIDPSKHYYLCGSGEMVMEVRKMLTEAGTDPKQIHFEIF